MQTRVNAVAWVMYRRDDKGKRACEFRQALQELQSVAARQRSSGEISSGIDKHLALWPNQCCCIGLDNCIAGLQDEHGY